jgi:hypothetical protein
MKAVVVHQYGGPEVLKFEDYPDPVPGPGEVLVRVAAASVNPIDYKRRAGLTKDFLSYPLPGPHRSRYRGDSGQDWAGGGRFFRRRQGVRHGGQYLRRTLCRKCSDLGEDP